ncbi:MAG TPA: lysophospholipid acyltransferase family protein [Gaiellaceae bacterium]|nr:lysophospholipid acyltransferase family protein [Gaiellaceae bacterium]
MAPKPSRAYNLVAVLSRPLFLRLYRLEARGLERLPAEGGYVLAANHVSNLDPWPLGLPLWPGRFLRFMAKSDLYWWPLSLLLAGAGAFPVRRGQADVEAIETAVELAREGHVVAMFPEGTRARKGLRKRFAARPRTGAARIALDAGVPLVPAAIGGTDRLARLGKLRVAYGEPLPPAGTPQELTDRLMAEIERLRESL